MVYVDSLELLNATKTETENGATVTLQDNIEGMIFVADFASVGGTTPTFDLKIQHSHDATLWFDLTSFTQATADTSELKEIAVTAGVMKYIRYVLTVTGTTPTADITLNAVYNKLRVNG